MKTPAGFLTAAILIWKVRSQSDKNNYRDKRVHKVLFNLIFFSSLMPSLAQSERSKGSSSAKTMLAIGVGALIVLAALFVGTGMQNALSPAGSHDFQWTPSKDVVDGVNPYREFMTWKEQGNASVPPHFLNQSPSYPASTYILLSPFAHFEWETAKSIWLVANLIFIALLLLGMQKVFPVSSPTILVLLVLSFLIASPLRTSLGAGQHNFISLAAFIWAYYFAHTGSNKSLSGILLAVAWIKYSLTFPLTLIFLRRETYKPVLFAAAIHAVLTCIAAWRIGMWPHEFFFNSVQVVLMGDGTGFLNLIAMCMNLELPLPVPLTIIAIASVAAAYALHRNKDADPLLVMAFLGMFSCAVFYHHGYDFVVLLMCAWALAQGSLQGIARHATVCLLAIAWIGQWFAQELTTLIGPYPAMCIDYLLVSVFYYTLFLLGKAIYQKRLALKPVSAVSF